MNRLFLSLAVVMAAGSAWSQVTPPPGPASDVKPASAPKDGTAKMDLDELVHDFGRIGEGSVVKHSIKFTNSGNAELVISELKPSCGCVQPTLRDKKRKYAPGESGYIDISWEPNSKEGDKEYYVFLRSNDPAKQSADFKLTVKAHTLAFVFSDSTDGVNLSGEHGQKLTKTLKIRGRAEDFKATYASITSEMEGKVDIKIVGEPRTIDLNGEKIREYDAVITASERLSPGRYTGQIYVRHSDKRAKMLEIPLTVDVQGVITSTPGTINAGDVVSGGMLSGSTEIKNSKGKAFKVVSAKFVPARITTFNMNVTTEPGATPDSWKVNIKGVAPSKHGRVDGEVVVTTDLPEEETVRIPVTMMVTSQGGPVTH